MIYVVGKDITPQRGAAHALKESETQFRLLVDGVIDYAPSHAQCRRHRREPEPRAQRIKGYSASEIIGQHFSRFYTDDDRAAQVPERALTIALRDGRYEAEGWRVRKDGTRFWASVVIDAVRNERGVLIGFAKITRDITERRNAQTRLEETQRLLAHAQKMEALGQLTGGVAHDFNNMLMVISGQAQMLKNRLSHPNDVRSVRAIELAAQRGETLTRQLLAFSRRQTLNPVPIRLQRRFLELRDILRSSARENIRLVVEIPSETWSVEADVAELELALVNIVVNARDAMPEGGTLSITAENTVLGAVPSPDDLRGEFVAIHVTDSGVGIAEDAAANLRAVLRRTRSTAAPAWDCRRSMASDGNRAARS